MKRTKYIRYVEFEELYKEFKPNEIIFDTRQQKWKFSPLAFYLTFSSLSFYYAPNAIFFTGASGEIALQCVEKVKIVTATENLIEAVIICGTGIKGETQKFKISLKRNCNGETDAV